MIGRATIGVVVLTFSPFLFGCSTGSQTAKLQQELKDATTRLDQAQRKLQTLSAKGSSSNSKAQLLLLEKEAQIKDLTHRLDDAIQEVVRAKAKLRSLGSKAEAASTMAEAEIALKSLKTSRPDTEKNASLRDAEGLLKMASTEFRKENFGGALYLSSQAKTQIKEGEELHGKDKTPPLPAEVAFALPLPLRLTESAKLRTAPSEDATPVSDLPRGSPLLGLSHKGDWVRVKLEDGQGGWLYYSQVEGRER